MAKRKKATTVVISLDLDEQSEQIEAAAERLEAIGEAVQGFGETLSKVLTLPLTLLGAPALAASESLRSAADEIRRSTGAAGERLRDLMSSLRDAREQTGAGVTEASQALIALSRGLGLSGDSLTSAVVAVTRVAQLANADIASSAQAVVRATKAFADESGDVSSTAALLQTASRKTGESFEQVANRLADLAPILKTAGLDIKSSAALLSDLAARGIPAEKAFDALKQAIAKIVQSGASDIPTTLSRHIEQIRACRDQGEAARMAADLFGEQAVFMADAIRRGAFNFNAMKELAASAIGPEPVESLSIAFGKLRAAIETLLAPIGAAIARVLVLASEPIVAIVKAVGEVVRWLDALPEGAKTGLVVVTMIAAVVGPALAMAAAGMAFVASMGFSSAMLARLGVAAVAGAIIAAGVGYATAGEKIEKAAEKATVANPATEMRKAAASIGQLAQSVGSAAREVVPDSPIPALPTPTLEPMPRFQFAPVPPMPDLPTPKFNTAPLNLPNIDVPDMPVPHIPMPSFSMPSIPDWQREFENAMRNAPGVPPRMMPMDWPSFLPKPGEDLAAAMRAQAPKVQDWWSAMVGSGQMPMGPLMPGSWLDANRPEAWMRRAAEVEDIMRRNRMRDEFHMQMADRRNQMEVEQWNRNQFALKHSPYGNNQFGLPQIYIARDISNAVQDGLDRALGGQPAPAAPGAPPATGPKLGDIITIDDRVLVNDAVVLNDFVMMGAPGAKPAPTVIGNTSASGGRSGKMAPPAMAPLAAAPAAPAAPITPPTAAPSLAPAPAPSSPAPKPADQKALREGTYTRDPGAQATAASQFKADPSGKTFLRKDAQGKYVYRLASGLALAYDLPQNEPVESPTPASLSRARDRFYATGAVDAGHLVRAYSRSFSPVGEWAWVRDARTAAEKKYGRGVFDQMTKRVTGNIIETRGGPGGPS